MKVYPLSVSSSVFIYKRLITLNYRLMYEKSSTSEVFIILRGGKVNRHEAIKRNDAREQTCLKPSTHFFFKKNILTFLNAITNERGKHTGLLFAKKPIHIGGGL